MRRSRLLLSFSMLMCGCLDFGGPFVFSGDASVDAGLLVPNDGGGQSEHDAGGSSDADSGSTADGGTLNDAGTQTQLDAGVTVDAGSTTDAGTPDDAGLLLDTPAKIYAFLKGKTFIMRGADIPPYPNGFSEDLSIGASTQCYERVVFAFGTRVLTQTAWLGKIEPVDGGELQGGDTGECDHAPRYFFGPSTSNSLTISNVRGNAACFDIDVIYSAFGQEGRGAVTDGGLELEIFYANTFRRHRCIDGDPGRSAVEKRAAPLRDGGIIWVWFDGGAVQRFVDESL